MHLFTFGLGYSAEVLARRLASEGWRITGTSTTAAGAERIRSLGFGGLVFDGTAPGAGIAAALGAASHVLLSIPPGPDGDPAFRHHARDIAARPGPGWIGYLSTIAVYGDQQGGWIDETMPANPASERGKRRLAAEAAWLDFAARNDLTLMVFRLPGIYGPGRSVLDDLAEGTARRLVKKGQVFNRIHVEDIARGIEAAMARPRAGAVFNLTDDEPAPPQDVVEYAARLAGLPVPPEIDFETADLTPMARSFYSENKRVRNSRLKAELGFDLAYPTYREGLAAIQRAMARQS